MYVVAAISEQPGPPAIQATKRWQPVSTMHPVGTQHAAVQAIRAPPPTVALCGEGIKGWVIFTRLPFDPGSSASCQRCAQLTWSAAPRR
ncbi:MAG: hypothetical protein ACXVXP_05655 [Mycobacteriaceae bacterium]